MFGFGQTRRLIVIFCTVCGVPAGLVPAQSGTATRRRPVMQQEVPPCDPAGSSAMELLSELAGGLQAAITYLEVARRIREPAPLEPDTGIDPLAEAAGQLARVAQTYSRLLAVLLPAPR